MTPEDTESTPLLSSHEEEDDNDTVSSASLREQRAHTRLASSFRRPSFISGGGRGFLLSSTAIPETALRDDEAFDCVREERGLLKRSSIEIPGGRRGSAIASSVGVNDVEETWEEAVKGGKIKTSWRYELGVMARYSVFPFLLFKINLLGTVGSYFLYDFLWVGLI
jgi:hypothetical protein